MSDQETVDRLIDDQIAEIEGQVESQAPDDVVEEFSWEEGAEESPSVSFVDSDIDPDTLEEMWKTTLAYTEQYLAKAEGRSPEPWEYERWGFLEEAFRRNPKFWAVADCTKCDWVQGGWLSEQRADKALLAHDKAKH